MMDQSIHKNTSIGVVNLGVRDLERQKKFYMAHIGFRLIEDAPYQTRLGVGEKELLRLTRIEDARTESGKTGLYHFAILLPSRTWLGKCLQHLSQNQVPFQGFADHGVSEAIYLKDLEGNGIEIYRDRPREHWPYSGNQLLMTTDPLDIDSILAESSISRPSWIQLPDDTKIGHVHLKVSDIKQAENYYTKIMGFDLILRYGTAAGFVSAGGYHHHIGYNTWESRGASPPSKNSTGLLWYSIDLPNSEALDSVISRLSDHNVATNENEVGWLVPDPAGIHSLLRIPQTG